MSVLSLLTEEQKEQYAKENEALIYYVVNMFRQTTRVDFDELVSIGMVGYAKALNAYDQSRNVKFSTYAINCIRNEILFFLRKENKHMQNTMSMNMVLAVDKNGNDLSLEETISNLDLDERSLEEDVIASSDVEILKKALKHLTPKEEYIITYRYGLNNGEIKTQREIADTIGMSQANVSKIQKNILEKLKVILKKHYKTTDNALT